LLNNLSVYGNLGQSGGNSNSELMFLRNENQNYGKIVAEMKIKND